MPIHVSVENGSAGADGWTYAPPCAEYGYGSARLLVTPSTVTIRRPRSTDDAIVRLLALGPGLAGVLAVQSPVLHATTLRTRVGDVALTGPSGVGKSTLAAAWIAAGAELVADDLSVLEDGAVRRGIGRLKLWESAVAVGARLAGWADRERVHPDHAKFAVPVPLAAHRAPLGRVLVLERGSGIERLTGADALTALLANHRLPEMLDAAGNARWFDAMSQLARHAEVLRVGLPATPDPLGELVGRLEAGG